MAIFNAILLLTGSLGFLLYGMRLMSSGVQKSAGEKLHRPDWNRMDPSCGEW